MRAAWAFAFSLFVSATLLFACQPLVARMIMPILGGAPAVWIVCSLCSQALLLAGYGYAHLIGTRLRIRTQVIVQLVLVVTVFATMPIGVDPVTAERLTADHPTFGVVALFLRTVGLAFFVLSSTSPLLQRWIVELGEDDPYWLYVASNAGSMLSLLGYPFVLEPTLTLRAQSRALLGGYAVYAVLVAVCGVLVMRAPKRAPSTEEAPPPSSVLGLETPKNVWVERAVWLALAFAPSSLLLSATQYVTTDIASVPFLWVAPLALYLGSFIIAFAKKPLLKPEVLSRIVALLAVIIVLTMSAGNAQAPWLLVGPHFLFVLVGSTACHYGLAIRRPRAGRLTEFYFILSLGGVLGGIFNGLLAPAIFTDLYEYPIAFGVVGISRLALEKPEAGGERKTLARDVAFGLALAVVTYILVRIGTHFRIPASKSFIWMFGIPLFVVYVWKSRPLRFGVALTGVFLASMLYGDRANASLLHRERSFFGVLGVLQDAEGRFRILVHGRINHGREVLDPALKDRPSSYYTLEGPVGDVLGKREGTHAIGVLGLGIGGLAKYARPGDTWTFFELDPNVLDVAREHFSILSTAEKITKVDVEIGDGRLRLQHGPPARFDILILDAFTSDGVPVHLLTREALEIYKRVLKPSGLILANSSNSHLNLRPVFGALARDGKMSAITRFDPADEERIRNGAESSIWVLFSESPSVTDKVIADSGNKWKPIEVPPGQVAWTDDFSNVLGALK